MPQLSQIGEIYASQLFWLAIVFALIYFGIGRAMVPKIERTMDDRQARISGDLTAAQGARDRAQGIEQTYTADMDTARHTATHALAAAKAKAGAASEAQLKSTGAALADRIAAASVEVEAAKQRSLGEIEAFTVEAVEQIVAKVSGTPVDRTTVAQRVKAELAHG